MNGTRVDDGRVVEYARAAGGGPAELAACLESLRPGDVLTVASLDQLGRSQRELITAVTRVRERGAGFRSRREGLDTTAPGGAAIFAVFAGLADIGRAAIATGTSEGLAAARAQGKRIGRPPALDARQLGEVRALLARPEHSVSSVAAAMGVSRSTLYKYLPDLPAPARPATAHLAPYPARPGRQVLVIDDLADLRGPTAGIVELPMRLFWHPNRVFDLDEPGIKRWVYQIVLREATRPEDLAAHLDGATLARLWPDLRLPRGVRQAWEAGHPSLLVAAGA